MTWAALTRWLCGCSQPPRTSNINLSVWLHYLQQIINRDGLHLLRQRECRIARVHWVYAQLPHDLVDRIVVRDVVADLLQVNFGLRRELRANSLRAFFDYFGVRLNRTSRPASSSNAKKLFRRNLEARSLEVKGLGCVVFFTRYGGRSGGSTLISYCEKLPLSRGGTKALRG
jgi:hypothetical protein